MIKFCFLIGNFHVSTHSADKQPDSADMAHYITSLTFGEMLDKKNLPGNFNPLARRDRSHADPAESHDYTMKIVPTIYEDSAGTTLVSYQYTYAYSVSLLKSMHTEMFLIILKLSQIPTELCFVFSWRPFTCCYLVSLWSESHHGQVSRKASTDLRFFDFGNIKKWI